ncbi:MAG TPA: flagellar biosynthetic protein FliR [Candidatus Cybelea sp.]|nr:flagellar biosynthetic protein FliR [Candidatus Cybelea sp.]
MNLDEVGSKLLNDIVPGSLFAFMLVFTRLGAALMLIPGLGEVNVSPRIRLSAAIALTLLLLPLVAPGLPPPPDQPLGDFVLIMNETLIGVFIGAAARLALAGLETAGTVIAFQSGLGYAQFFDPTQGGQGQLVASFLSLVGLVMIFASNLHYLMLEALAESYRTFPAGAMPVIGDFTETAVRFVSGSFRIGVQVAAPFIVYGLVYTVGAGVLNRLMPQVQLMLISVPLQIAASMLLLAATLGAAMSWFLAYYRDAASLFLAH